mmetsp:Transcript_25221/g.72623  ORF Transcript_25221/g.72623 Transcript_25221/m.72623 type:complete len:208 (-) Transcript_25221:87-710(-)
MRAMAVGVEAPLVLIGAAEPEFFAFVDEGHLRHPPLELLVRRPYAGVDDPDPCAAAGGPSPVEPDPLLVPGKRQKTQGVVLVVGGLGTVRRGQPDDPVLFNECHLRVGIGNCGDILLRARGEHHVHSRQRFAHALAALAHGRGRRPPGHVQRQEPRVPRGLAEDGRIAIVAAVAGGLRVFVQGLAGALSAKLSQGSTAGEPAREEDE